MHARLTSVSEQRVANIVTQQVTKALTGSISEQRGSGSVELLPPRQSPAVGQTIEEGGSDGSGYASVAQVARLEKKIVSSTQAIPATA